MNQSRDNRKKRNFKKKNKKRGKGQPQQKQKAAAPGPEFINNQNVQFGGQYSGIIEINEKGYGFIRKLDYEFSKTKNDPFLFPEEVRFNNLKTGLGIEGQVETDQKGNVHVATIENLMNGPLERWTHAKRFELQTPIMPNKHMKLGFNPDDVEMRVVDLIAPIGFGQRALIVAPPRTGKTVLLKKIAHSIDAHYPDVHLAVLLVDERPEEVTDFMRTTKGRVFASSNDRNTESHVRISEMALGYVKRMAEMGEDAVLLIDSLTRMGRAY
ncbi:MAG: transcription termination factor Rho, partial [Balneolales bacterium]|nr:transcription termination factor Rho [Balneolales bacterium]